MKSSVRDKDGAKIIEILEDHITVTNVNQFRELVQKLIDKGATRVILNMGQVKHLDSMGLGALVGMSEAFKYSKGQLVLTNIQSSVRRLFRVTEMEQVFTIVETE